MYYRRPSDLSSLSDTIPLPDDTHLDLALYVTSILTPTNDLLLKQQQIKREWERRYKRAYPFREAKTWKQVRDTNFYGHYPGDE